LTAGARIFSDKDLQHGAKDTIPLNQVQTAGKSYLFPEGKPASGPIGKNNNHQQRRFAMKTFKPLFVLLSLMAAIMLAGNAVAQGMPSVTGGSYDGDPGEGAQTDIPAPVEEWHPAAQFYGFRGIDQITYDEDACGQRHLYAIGLQEKDLIEYVMNFGGAYRYLILRGKADRPGPVELDIYIDGDYQASVEWDNDDNLNQDVVVEIPRVNYGPHAIAVEMARDDWVQGGGADQDLNLYLHSLKASSTGLGGTLRVVSNDSWKSYDREIPGWSEVEFDDSGWRSAYAPYPNPTPPGQWICGTRAELIWDYPDSGTPDGKNGPRDAWFRKSFNIAVEPAAIESARLIAAADDDFKLYVNGILVEPVDWDGTLWGAPYEYDIRDKLQKGRNVFAIHARDSYGIYEWLLVDAVIKHRPLSLRLHLRVEDAPVGFQVHKLAGDFAGSAQQTYLDFQARLISSASIGPIPVVLTIPDDLFGAPVNAWVKASPGAAPTSIAFENLGDGCYRVFIDPTLYPRHEAHLVWRFEIPNDLQPRKDIHVLAEIDIPQSKTFSSATLHLAQPGDVQAIYVANRTLLYRHYNEFDVTRLLGRLFIEAQGQPFSDSPSAAIYYVDRYHSDIENWDNTNIDYTSQATANEVADRIDGLIEDWWEDSVRYVDLTIPIINRTMPVRAAFAHYLLIVDDDNGIPFYRYTDPSGDEGINWGGWGWNSNVNPIVLATDENYILTDNPYADLTNNDWQTGDIELWTGRLLGVTAADMIGLLSRGVDPANGGRGGVVMASVDGWELGLEPDPNPDPDGDGVDNFNVINDLHDVTALFRNRGFAVRNDDNPNTEIRTIDVNADASPGNLVGLEVGENDWNDAFVAAANHADGMDLFFIGGHDEPDHASIPGDDYSPDDTPGRYTRFGTDHPIVMITGCHGGLPVPDIDVPRIPSGGVDGNMVYDAVHEGGRAYIGATGFSYGSANRLYVCTWGERLMQDFFDNLLSPADTQTLPIGRALTEAKRDFAFGFDNNDNLDRKTVTEFNLYGVPWATIRYPGAAPAPFAVQGGPLAKVRAPAFSASSVSVAPSAAPAAYSLSFEVRVDDYDLVAYVEDEVTYDLFSIPGGETSMADGLPVLPYVKAYTLPLPQSASVTAVDVTPMECAAIGTFNVPTASVRPFTQGGVSFTTDTGIDYPYPQAENLVRFQPTTEGLLFTVFPIQHNPTTDETSLCSRFVIQVSYEAPLTIGIRDFSTDKPQYHPDEVIQTSAWIDNVGDADVTLGATVGVKDADGNPVGPAVLPVAITVPAGGSYDLQLPCGGNLTHGSYTVELSLLSGGDRVGVAVARFTVVGVEITDLAAPENLQVNESGRFDITLANYQEVEFIGHVRLSILGADGSPAAELPDQYLLLGAHETATINFTWSSDKPGRFEAIATVGVGEKIFDSRSAAFEVIGADVLLVVATGGLNAGDRALLDHLEQTGHTVTVRDAQSTEASDADGKSVVVISESCYSGDVNTKFRDVTVPVISFEPAVFDDMRLTGPTWATDYGDAHNQQQLDILQPTHPVAAGLSGRVSVTTTPQKFIWGKPSTSALRIAAIAGRPHQAAIFAYAEGSQMVGMTAPARRIGWFAGRDTPAAFNAIGWQLFDAALSWAVSDSLALLVVDAIPLTPSDEALQQRLQRLGYLVEAQTGAAVSTADAANKAVIVVSESTQSKTVTTKFRDVAVPLVSMEPAIFDDLQMTGHMWMSDFGDQHSQRTLSIVLPDHSLAAGLPAGDETVTGADSKYVWGSPAASALAIATITGHPDRVAIFGYESGAPMMGMDAPARRVGWFAGRDTPQVLTEDGWNLFDAAIQWATDR
jgi:hypothetical protein